MAFVAAARALRELPDERANARAGAGLVHAADADDELAALLAEVAPRASNDKARATLYRALARLQARTTRSEEAVESWKRVLELVPTDAEAMRADRAAASRARGGCPSCSRCSPPADTVEEDRPAAPALLFQIGSLQEEQLKDAHGGARHLPPPARAASPTTPPPWSAWSGCARRRSAGPSWPTCSPAASSCAEERACARAEVQPGAGARDQAARQAGGARPVHRAPRARAEPPRGALHAHGGAGAPASRRTSRRSTCSWRAYRRSRDVAKLVAADRGPGGGVAPTPSSARPCWWSWPPCARRRTSPSSPTWRCTGPSRKTPTTPRCAPGSSGRRRRQDLRRAGRAPTRRSCPGSPRRRTPPRCACARAGCSSSGSTRPSARSCSTRRPAQLDPSGGRRRCRPSIGSTTSSTSRPSSRPRCSRPWPPLATEPAGEGRAALPPRAARRGAARQPRPRRRRLREDARDRPQAPAVAALARAALRAGQEQRQALSRCSRPQRELVQGAERERLLGQDGGQVSAEGSRNVDHSIELYRELLQKNPRNEQAFEALEQAAGARASATKSCASCSQGKLQLTIDPRELVRLNDRLGRVLCAAAQARRRGDAVLQGGPRARRPPHAARSTPCATSTTRLAASDDLVIVLRRLIPLQEDAEGVKAHPHPAGRGAGRDGAARRGARRRPPLAGDRAAPDRRAEPGARGLHAAEGLRRRGARAGAGRQVELQLEEREAAAAAMFEVAELWRGAGGKPESAGAGAGEACSRSTRPTGRPTSRPSRCTRQVNDWRAYAQVMDRYLPHLVTDEEKVGVAARAGPGAGVEARPEGRGLPPVLPRAAADARRTTRSARRSSGSPTETGSYEELAAVYEEVADDAAARPAGRARVPGAGQGAGHRSSTTPRRPRRSLRKILEFDPTNETALERLGDDVQPPRPGQGVRRRARAEARGRRQSIERRKEILREIARVFDEQLERPARGGDRAACARSSSSPTRRRSACWWRCSAARRTGPAVASTLLRMRDIAPTPEERARIQVEVAQVYERELARRRGRDRGLPPGAGVRPGQRGGPRLARAALHQARPPGRAARGLRAPARADPGLPRAGEGALQERVHLGGPLPEPGQRRRLHRGGAVGRPAEPPGDQDARAAAQGPGTVGGAHRGGRSPHSAAHQPRREGRAVRGDGRHLPPAAQAGGPRGHRLPPGPRARRRVPPGDARAGHALRAQRQLALRPRHARARGAGGRRRPPRRSSCTTAWGRSTRTCSSTRQRQALLPRGAAHRRRRTCPAIRALKGIYEIEKDWELYEKALVEEAQQTEDPQAQSKALLEVGRYYAERKEDREASPPATSRRRCRLVPDSLEAARPLADIYLVDASDWARCEQMLDIVAAKLAQQYQASPTIPSWRSELCRRSYRLGYVAEKHGKHDKALRGLRAGLPARRRPTCRRSRARATCWCRPSGSTRRCKVYQIDPRPPPRAI